MKTKYIKLNEHNYIFQSPEITKLIKHPEIAGVKFTNLLKAAVTKALKKFPFDKPAEVDTNVLTFLRGGLNFGIREALYDAWDYNEHSSSFISSQRVKKGKTWNVVEKSYRKFTCSKNPTVFIGEVVATGVTLKQGIPILLRNCTPKHVYLFVIGCINADKVLSALLPRRNYTIVYLGDIFKLEKNETDLTSKATDGECAIGDAGERAFNPYSYLKEIK